MRHLMTALAALTALASCGHPSDQVPQDPPERLQSQVDDKPDDVFLATSLVVGEPGHEKSYCYTLQELLRWFESQGVRDQRWTQLDDDTWRLDGFGWESDADGKRKLAHTVWVFQRQPAGLRLVQYKDSDIAERTHDSILELYYGHLSGFFYFEHERRDPKCERPYPRPS